MNSAIILAAENRTLRIENERVKRKRAQKRVYVGRRVVLNAGEVQKESIPTVIEQEMGNSEIQGLQEQPVERAPRRCSKCRSFYTLPGHARTRNILIYIVRFT